MKASLALMVLGSLGMLATGCSASPADETQSSSNDLTSVRHLGDLSAAELRTAASARFRDSLAQLTDAHPDVREVSTANLEAFVAWDEQVGTMTTSHVDHDVYDTVVSLLRWTEQTELGIGELRGRFDAWLDTQVPSALLASGKVACEQLRPGLVARACGLAQREKAIANARPATGADLPGLAHAWQDAMADREGARFTSPIVLDGEASVTEIKSLAGVSPYCRQRAWGDEAVDAFVAQHPEVSRFAPGLKAAGIEKRWYWACGSDSWGEDGFALLDEHHQLWAFGTYSSE